MPATDVAGTGNGGAFANVLAGADEEAPYVGPDTEIPTAPLAVSAPALAGDVANNAHALSTSNPAPRKPGDWARALMGGVQNALAGIHNSPGGLFYEASEGARQQQAIQRQQKQQQFENQQKQAQMTREQQITNATLAESNARKVHQQQLTSSLEYDNRQKSYALDKTMADGYLKVGAPVIQDGIDSDEMQKLLAQGKLSGHKYVPLVTGQVPIIGADGEPSFSEDGNPLTRPTYTVFDPKGIPDVPLSPEQSEIISKNTPYKLPPGTPVGGVLLAHLSQLAASNQTAQLSIEEDLNKAKLGDAITQDDIAAQRARPKWTTAKAKAKGDVGLALQHLSETDPDTAAVIPRLYATDKGSGDENLQKIIEYQKKEADEVQAKRDELAKKKTEATDFTGDPNAVDPVAFRNSLEPNARGVVDQIGQGRAPLSNPGYLLARKPEIMGAVEKAYPGFDGSKVTSYQQAYKDYTSGKTAVTLNAGATALEHLAELRQLNTLASRIPTTPASQAYQSKLDTVAAELARFYGTTTEEGIESLKKTLDPRMPWTSRAAAITTQAKSMGDKLDQFEQEWLNAAPSKAYQAPMPGISNAAKQARASMDPDYAKRIGASTQIPQGSVTVQIPGQPPGHIPQQNISAFKAAHPDATIGAANGQ